MSNTPTAADQLAEAARNYLQMWWDNHGDGCTCCECKLAAALRRHDEERAVRESQRDCLKMLKEYVELVVAADGERNGAVECAEEELIEAYQLLAARQAASEVKP